MTGLRLREGGEKPGQGLSHLAAISARRDVLVRGSAWRALEIADTGARLCARHARCYEGQFHGPEFIDGPIFRLRVFIGRELVGGDRKSVVSGKSVSVRVDPGGRRIINKKN